MAAVPKKPEPGDWLKAAADELKQGDRATLTLLQETYRHINQILKDLPEGDSAAAGDLIYRAQMERVRRDLLTEQSKMFEKLGDVAAARRLRSASRAAKLSAASDAAYLRLVGQGDEGKRLYDGANITSQRTIETMLTRLNLSKVPLAEKIYKTETWMNGRLDLLIAKTMSSGLNAKRFAKIARDWFSPSVPGGTRYAANRLARTEINNAFHATSIAYAQDKPWVSDMDWNLSKSHPAPDKCNEYAAESPWPVIAVPPKPHPQCMCYITERPVDDKEWIDRFIAGEFDDYLDREMGALDTPVEKGVTSSTGKPINIDKPKTADVPNINPAAAAVLSQLEVGSKVRLKTTGAEFTVAKIGPKSIFFTDGKHENIRGLHNFDVIGDDNHAGLLTGKDALDSVPKGMYKRGSMTPEQRSALKVYESGWFSVMNGFLREERWGNPEDAKEERDINRIDSAMAESVLPQDVLVHRGLFKATTIFGEERFAHDLSGFSWEEKAYSSTTANEEIVKLFNVSGENPRFKYQNVHMTVTVPAGTKALATSTFEQGSKANGPQAELTLQRGMKWTVVKDNGVDTNGVRQLEVRADPIGQRTLGQGTNAGPAGRRLQTSDPGRAKAPIVANTNDPEDQLTFNERVAFAAKDEKALAASNWGLGRAAQPTAFSPQWRTAINRYTGSMYKDINAVLRGGKPQFAEDEAKVATTIADMDAAFKETAVSSREVLVYRGVRNASLMFGDRLNGDLTGLEWREEAFSSTTSVAARTRTFLGRKPSRVQMRILIPAGSRTIQASPRAQEAEILVNRNSRFRVVKDNGLDSEGLRHIDVELVE